MIISHSQLQEVLRAYGGATAKTEKTGAKDGGKSVAPGKRAITDSLTLSAEARELQRVKELALQAPAVRRQKVEEVQKRIKEGSYDVSGEEIAAKILTRLLVDELI
ncbi:MAG: flagellar biosynthesis anti-sigma factor FlgM [Firmicutes bacterium]|nr:flagellar biosynthesis anti-sigma factor FlgM [Bacillota bacterium]